MVDMQTVAVVSQKGGAGKTTLAIHLGVAASAAGLVSLIVDTDPQATASKWGTWRGGRDPEVIDCAAHASVVHNSGIWVQSPQSRFGVRRCGRSSGVRTPTYD